MPRVFRKSYTRPSRPMPFTLPSSTRVTKFLPFASGATTGS
jgi:hypothetical protein